MSVEAYSIRYASEMPPNPTPQTGGLGRILTRPNLAVPNMAASSSLLSHVGQWISVFGDKAYVSVASKGWQQSRNLDDMAYAFW